MYAAYFLPGDQLFRRKGLVTHYGIAITDALILEIVPDSVPGLVSLDTFAAGQLVTQFAHW